MVQMPQPQRLQGLSCPKTLVRLRALGVHEKATLPRLDWVSSQGSRGNRHIGESLKTDDRHLRALPFSGVSAEEQRPGG
jgi:hypothetical protein